MQFRPVGTEASCISARPIPLDMAAAAAHQQQQLWLLPSHCKESSRLCCHGARLPEHRTASTARLRRHGAIGMRRGCESADGPPSHVISSCLQVQHAAHAIGAWQHAAAAAMSLTAAPPPSDPPEPAAESGHQLLPARAARGGCDWYMTAGRWCSDVALSSST